MASIVERPGHEQDPAQVFTPAQPVQRDMFAGRRYGDLQDRFQDRLNEPGRQIVLYGDTGVGKTSLVTYICETQDVPMIRVECGQPFDAMLMESLARAGITEESFEAIERKSAYAGVRGTLAVLFAGGRHDLEDTVRERSYPVSIQTAAREALSVQGIRVLFLDNFENLRPREYREQAAVEIVQLMKACADRADGVKVIVAGIPFEAEQLMAIDEATGRRTAQIEVPRMPDEELDEILRKGEAKLGIEFDADCRTTIIRYSDGFPYYTHLHALHAVRRALRDGRVRVMFDDFMNALDSIIDDTDLTLRRQYEDAAETTGTVKVRRSIMEAIARTEKQELTFREIKASFREIHQKYDMKQADLINPHLSALVEKYHVLQSRGLPKSKDRLYRFANPLMRAYVRLMARQAQQNTPRLIGG
jgi:AAA domain